MADTNSKELYRESFGFWLVRDKDAWSSVARGCRVEVKGDSRYSKYRMGNAILFSRVCGKQPAVDSDGHTHTGEWIGEAVEHKVR